MDKNFKEIIKLLLGHIEKKCRKGKSGKYDGWRCDEIPQQDFPIKEWCSGCLASLVEVKTKELKKCHCEWCPEHAGLGEYDEDFGDDEECKCSHPYYRHFDTYDKMRAIGCKYCYCHNFELKEEK